MINNFDELEEKKDQLRGKIVFYNYKFNPALSALLKPMGMLPNTVRRDLPVRLNTAL
ncbi:hypothetical protein [Niabella hibiscisoli]|uniref:hypothetical protein n=1 Tax=Niabella hibiscisoli TaxID=1825928 RepID=UPI001F0F67F2|nr:hypothetical protein [Niabella hibiscisoli]MCH5716757.1 hypothetical protein [Niabella hibiscisoli]